jgi:hypothetical protein
MRPEMRTSLTGSIISAVAISEKRGTARRSLPDAWDPVDVRDKSVLIVAPFMLPFS